jgi:hypothetical protein
VNVVALHADRRRRLDEVVAELEATRWAFEVLDSSWRLHHISNELRQLLYEKDACEDEQIPLGAHFVESRYHPAYGMVTDASRRRCAGPRTSSSTGASSPASCTTSASASTTRPARSSAT